MTCQGLAIWNVIQYYTHRFSLYCVCKNLPQPCLLARALMTPALLAALRCLSFIFLPFLQNLTLVQSDQWEMSPLFLFQVGLGSFHGSCPEFCMSTAPFRQGKWTFWGEKPLPQRDRGESTPELVFPGSVKPSASLTSEASVHTGLRRLTCSLVIRIDRIFPCGVNPQEGLVVIVFIPVEGEHPRASSLWVATQEVRQDAHQLCEGLWTTSLQEGPGCPPQVLNTWSMDELG